MANHVGVQVAAGAGVDLAHRDPGGGDPVGVVAGLLVPLDDGAAGLTLQVGEGPLQEGGLAGAGGADQVEDEDPLFAEKRPVAGSQPVVLGEDVALDGDDFGVMVMVVAMRSEVQFVGMVVTPAVGVDMLMGFGRAAAAGGTHAIRPPVRGPSVPRRR